MRTLAGVRFPNLKNVWFKYFRLFYGEDKVIECALNVCSYFPCLLVYYGLNKSNKYRNNGALNSAM
jgi:hypothetical protein